MCMYMRICRARAEKKKETMRGEWAEQVGELAANEGTRAFVVDAVHSYIVVRDQK